jgi:hypothetical protein
MAFALQASLLDIVAHGMAGFDYARAKAVAAVPDGYEIQVRVVHIVVSLTYACSHTHTRSVWLQSAITVPLKCCLKTSALARSQVTVNR